MARLMNVSVIAHNKIPNLFYKKESSNGFTRNIMDATRYHTDDERCAGLKELMQRYPKVKIGSVIYTYIG